MSSDTVRALANAMVQLGPRTSRFCQQLLRHREGSRITWSTLKPLVNDPTGLTGLLVSTLTEAGAVAAAVDTLTEMGCLREAETLVMEAGRQPLPDPRSNQKEEEDDLPREVSDFKPILDELPTKGVIPQENDDKIRTLPTSEEKISEIFDARPKVVRGKDNFSEINMRWFPVEFEDLGPQGSASSHGGLEEVEPHILVNPATMVPGSETFPEADWIQLEPEVNCVDAEDAPIYSLQSEAGNFECSVSGVRWVCKEKVSFKYRFGSWEEHMERLETLRYIPGGPLLDIMIIAGKLDEAYLPHWICTEDNPTIVRKFAVLHIDTCGDVVEQVSRVTLSHVKLSQPIFSPRGVLVRAGFPVKINCKVLIYKTNKAFLTLHVYLIPRDPALHQAIKNKELSSGYEMIQKPYPEKSLRMHDRFVLTADLDRAEIYPQKLKLIYEGKDPNFFEVFIENPESNFQLSLTHESAPVWTCAIRKDDYQNTGDIQPMYDKELARLRPELVKRVSRELISQLLDDLLEDGVLNDGEKDSILQENQTIADRARCLIDIVKKKGCEASRKIFIRLQSRDPTLSAELGLPSGLPV